MFSPALYSYAIGTPVAANDKSILPQLTKCFAEAGFRLPHLLRSIALSPGFSNVIPGTAHDRVAADNRSQPERMTLTSKRGESEMKKKSVLGRSRSAPGPERHPEWGSRDRRVAAAQLLFK